MAQRSRKNSTRPAPELEDAPSLPLRDMLDNWLRAADFERECDDYQPPSINRAIARAIRMAYEGDTIDAPLHYAKTGEIEIVREVLRWSMHMEKAANDGLPPAARDAARLALVRCLEVLEAENGLKAGKGRKAKP